MRSDVIDSRQNWFEAFEELEELLISSVPAIADAGFGSSLEPKYTCQVCGIEASINGRSSVRGRGWRVRGSGVQLDEGDSSRKVRLLMMIFVLRRRTTDNPRF